MKTGKWAVATFDDHTFYVRQRGTLEIEEFASREDADAFMREKELVDK